MANSMNNYDLDYSAGRDEYQDPRDNVQGRLHPSLASQDPSLMDFPNPGNYAFGAMLPQEDGDLPLQAFNRPRGGQGDLEGRLSSVMLAYDAVPSSVSMPMNLDAGGAFAYDIPTTYPATSMGLAPAMDQQRHLQQTFPPFPQSLQQSNQYLQQPHAPTQTHNDPYNTGSNSTGSFEDSDFSRTSDPTQARPPRPIQERQRPPQYNQPASYRAPQPVAIQPKKPVVIKGKST